MKEPGALARSGAGVQHRRYIKDYEVLGLPGIFSVRHAEALMMMLARQNGLRLIRYYKGWIVEPETALVKT